MMPKIHAMTSATPPTVSPSHNKTSPARQSKYKKSKNLGGTPIVAHSALGVEIVTCGVNCFNLFLALTDNDIGE